MFGRHGFQLVGIGVLPDLAETPFSAVPDDLHPGHRFGNQLLGGSGKTMEPQRLSWLQGGAGSDEAMRVVVKKHRVLVIPHVGGEAIVVQLLPAGVDHNEVSRPAAGNQLEPRVERGQRRRAGCLRLAARKAKDQG